MLFIRNVTEILAKYFHYQKQIIIEIYCFDISNCKSSIVFKTFVCCSSTHNENFSSIQYAF